MKEIDFSKNKPEPEYSDKKEVKKQIEKRKKAIYYEEHIKKGIKTLSLMFEQDGLSKVDSERVIIYEKAIMRGKCIMDCMVVDTQGTVIGLEIKTEHDSTQRLKKQLDMYSLVCKYVYVVCHDNFIDKVEKILKRYHYDHVGIISYIDFNNQPTFGKYRKAKQSPKRSAYHTLDVLWKSELVDIYGGMRNPYKYYENGKRQITKNHDYNSLRGGHNTNKTRKPQLIANMRKMFGDLVCYELFGKSFVYGVTNSEKIFEQHYFTPIRSQVNDNE